MILNQLLHQTIKELLPIDSSFAEKESQLEVSRAYGLWFLFICKHLIFSKIQRKISLGLGTLQKLSGAVCLGTKRPTVKREGRFVVKLHAVERADD